MNTFDQNLNYHLVRVLTESDMTKEERWKVKVYFAWLMMANYKTYSVLKIEDTSILWYTLMLHYFRCF